MCSAAASGEGRMPSGRQPQLFCEVTHLRDIEFDCLSFGVFLCASFVLFLFFPVRLKQKGHRLQQISVQPGVHFVPRAVEQKMLQMNTHTRRTQGFAYEMNVQM